jgi:predicted DCC family thiol-disulfide oxidoreductase YuxK
MRRSHDILFPLTIFYDGSCPVCSREIAHYRALNRAGYLDFIDISTASFDAGVWGLDQSALMKAMHARDAAGRLYLGLEAFRALWLGLPGLRYRRLSQLLGLPGLHLLAILGYRVFARLRHLLIRPLPRDE